MQVMPPLILSGVFPEVSLQGSSGFSEVFSTSDPTLSDLGDLLDEVRRNQGVLLGRAPGVLEDLPPDLLQNV